MGARSAPQCLALMRTGPHCPLVAVAGGNAAGVGAGTWDRTCLPLRLRFFAPLRSTSERWGGDGVAV